MRAPETGQPAPNNLESLQNALAEALPRADTAQGSLRQLFKHATSVHEPHMETQATSEAVNEHGARLETATRDLSRAEGQMRPKLVENMMPRKQRDDKLLAGAIESAQRTSGGWTWR